MIRSRLRATAAGCGPRRRSAGRSWAAVTLADNDARLAADVVRYAFIVSDFHRLLLAGLPAHHPVHLFGFGLQSEAFRLR
ncbi:MAG: hypothetical protein GC191_01045 [Azospirillum sp.]|nr:hypothetical protein [Azospirillum sp.]